MNDKPIICPICSGEPAHQKALEDFVREMQEKTIPEIVRIMRERSEASNKIKNEEIF